MKRLKNILIILLLLLLIVPLGISNYQLSKKQTYYFSDDTVYEKCKNLVQEEHFGYILNGVDESNGVYVAYVRDITGKDQDKQEFNNKEALDKFIQEKTITSLEEIPVLNDFVEFNDGYLSVTYTTPYEWKDVFQNAQQYFYAGLYIYCFAGLLYLLIKKK